MGPLSGIPEATYPAPFTDGPPVVTYRHHRKYVTPRQIRSWHAGCRDGWRCSGPGCRLRTGKTRRNR